MKNVLSGYCMNLKDVAVIPSVFYNTGTFSTCHLLLSWFGPMDYSSCDRLSITHVFVKSVLAITNCRYGSLCLLISWSLYSLISWRSLRIASVIGILLGHVGTDFKPVGVDCDTIFPLRENCFVKLTHFLRQRCQYGIHLISICVCALFSSSDAQITLVHQSSYWPPDSITTFTMLHDFLCRVRKIWYYYIVYTWCQLLFCNLR